MRNFGFLTACVASCVLSAKAFDMHDSLLTLTETAQDHLIGQIETMSGRKLQPSEEDLGAIKNALMDAYGEYFASCFGAYGIDQYIRCELAVVFDIVFAGLIDGGTFDYSEIGNVLSEVATDLNASLTTIANLEGANPTANQCAVIFESDLVSCVALYLNGQAIVNFANAVDSNTPFAGNEQACSAMDTFFFGTETEQSQLSSEISEPLQQSFQGGNSRRSLQSDYFSESFESSEADEGQTEEEAVVAGITELNDIATSCQTNNPSVFADVPNIPPPSSAGFVRATVVLAFGVLAIFF